MKKIGDNAFYACKGLINVDIPESVEIIGVAAFCDAFLEGANVKLILPDGVKEIQSDAFYSSGLTEVDFPSSLKEIGSYAFKDVDRMRSIVIPASVEKISDGAFVDCLRLPRPDALPGLKGKNLFRLHTTYSSHNPQQRRFPQG